jgi:hypothetical protein
MRKSNTPAARRTFEGRHDGQLVGCPAGHRAGYLDRPPTPDHPVR